MFTFPSAFGVGDTVLYICLQFASHPMTMHGYMELGRMQDCMQDGAHACLNIAKLSVRLSTRISITYLLVFAHTLTDN